METVLSLSVQWEWLKKCVYTVGLCTLCIGYNDSLFLFRPCRSTSCPSCTCIRFIATCNSMRKAAVSGACPVVQPCAMMMMMVPYCEQSSGARSESSCWSVAGNHQKITLSKKPLHKFNKALKIHLFIHRYFGRRQRGGAIKPVGQTADFAIEHNQL